MVLKDGVKNMKLILKIINNPPAATNYAMRACMIYTNLLGCNRLKRQ